MSSKTKIIVLKSKELIYTGIFIVLSILLVLLLFYMFSPSKEEEDANKTTTTSHGTEEVKETFSTYQPGVYSTNLNLGGSTLELTVTVDEDVVSHVEIKNLDETVTAMYPLIQPSLDEINSQISSVNSLDELTYSEDNQYTSIIILNAIEEALDSGVE